MRLKTKKTALQLEVQRLPSEESGRNITFIDPAVLRKARLGPDRVVELNTRRGRRLLARVASRAQIQCRSRGGGSGEGRSVELSPR